MKNCHLVDTGHFPTDFVRNLTFSRKPSISDVQNRRKRAVNDDDLFLDDDDETTQEENSRRLSESLLTSAANGHKVRNIKQKIQEIGENSQLGRSKKKFE